LEASESCSQNEDVDKTIFSRQSECLRTTLAALRKKAGLTQRQLAVKLSREHSLVGRLELGERRLDMVEFYQFCKACGVEPEATARKLMRKFKEIEAKL
jgi:transcriptional regulator with XRE-family HTH domain